MLAGLRHELVIAVRQLQYILFAFLSQGLVLSAGNFGNRSGLANFLFEGCIGLVEGLIVGR